MTASIPQIHNQTQYSVDELLDMYKIDRSQLDEVREVSQRAIPEISGLIDSFYLWMGDHAEMMSFFRSDAVLKHVQQMQVAYWVRLLEADINEDYINDRRRIGEIHAKIGLPVMIYMAGVSMAYEHLSGIHSRILGCNEASQTLNQTIANILHMDAGLICQSFVDKRDALLQEQSQAVLSMSTPVTEIWDGILLLPIVGIVDSKRSEDIMNAVLECIKTSKAKEFILDISGVGVVDTAVANYLISITKATALMGCQTTISGISPAISKTIVQLGINVGDVHTTSTMMDALASAFSSRGISLKEKH
jgi:rsbT co-antagonist protein RsbR